MLSQLPDALVPLLAAGTLGFLAGIAASSGLSAWRRRRARVKARPAARPASAGGTVAALPPALPYAADLLLVDDSAVARAKLRKLAERAGYAVHLACDGVEALALLKKGRYNLMITDLEMPNMDGVALVQACRSHAPTARLPILAITGHESLRVKFNECRDISGIHPKPWVDDILLSHVAALVGARHEGGPAAVVAGSRTVRERPAQRSTAAVH